MSLSAGPNRLLPQLLDPVWGAGPEAWSECLVGSTLLETSWTADRARRDPTCLHELFEGRAAARPDAEAVVAGTERLTYGELNSRANALAHRLRAAGVGREVLVGIFLDRSPDLIVALLAVLKSAGAYVPLDPAYPPSRLAFMLADVRAHAIVTQPSLRGALAEITAGCPTSPQVLTLEREPGPPGTTHANPDPLSESSDLAYVIYTSGSTGQPKGVGLEHRNAVAFIRWAGTWFSPEELSGVLASTSVCFDVSMFEILATLGLGGRVILAANALELPTLPARNEVRMVVTSPSVLREILRMGPLPDSVVSLALAGEALDQSLVRRVYQSPRIERVHDLYGPTETTTYSTATVRRPDGPATIGRPIQGTQVYLLDENLRPAGAGEIGEICIGGAGVARGYLHRPDLTAQRFIPDPFSRHSRARLYRTGDLGRWRTDGELEYLGRRDHQVKIHGFRIELGEIESVLRAHEAVSETVVMAREDRPGDRRLVAYVVPEPGEPGESQADHEQRVLRELRHWIQERLPHYMVPGAIVLLARLPLTPNGKLDRAALPPPSRTRATGAAYVPPTTPAERALCEIWSEVLDVPDIGTVDDFLQLGGDSLLAVKLVLAVEKKFGVRLTPATIFQAPTIERFAALVDGRASAAGGSSLLELQTGASRAPLYLVHGVGGGMLWGYANLARHLSPEQPVYAFQAATSPRAEGESIPEMAARYRRELRAFQPHGPYHLGGFCFGGTLAFEIARQLEAETGEPCHVILINSTPPGSAYENPRWTPALAGRFIANVCRWLRRFGEWDLLSRRRFLDWKFRTLRQHAARLWQREAAPETAIDRETEINLADVPLEQRPLWNSHLEAQRRYRPQPFGGAVTLLRTSAHQFYCSFAPDFGWGPFARAGVSIRIVPGLHQSMLQEPNVAHLARELEAGLAAANTAAAHRTHTRSAFATP